MRKKGKGAGSLNIPTPVRHLLAEILQSAVQFSKFLAATERPAHCLVIPSEYRYSQPTPSLSRSRCAAYPGSPRRMGAAPAARAGSRHYAGPRTLPSAVGSRTKSPRRIIHRCQFDRRKAGGEPRPPQAIHPAAAPLRGRDHVRRVPSAYTYFTKQPVLARHVLQLGQSRRCPDVRDSFRLCVARAEVRLASSNNRV